MLPWELPLQKGINFRDQGGNTAIDGRKIKKGFLFRSGSLHELTESDLSYLSGLDIQSILDYRDASEINEYPDKVWPNATYYAIPANTSDKSVSAATTNIEVLLQEEPEIFMNKLYRNLPFNNPAYRKLITLLQDPVPKPLIQHCMVGKDRTGIGSALVLFLLGASIDTVMEDYLLTEKTLAPFKEVFLAKLSARLNDSQIERCKVILSVKESFLMSAITAIKDKYTTIDQWVVQEYGLTEPMKEKIRDFYLE